MVAAPPDWQDCVYVPAAALALLEISFLIESIIRCLISIFPVAKVPAKINPGVPPRAIIPFVGRRRCTSFSTQTSRSTRHGHWGK
jgi:hypothetical protein